MEVSPQQEGSQITHPSVMTRNDFADAYRKGLTKTVRFLLSRGVNRDTAEEVAQDAWGRGWLRRDSLRKQSAVIPWINTIALNIFRSRIRRQPVDDDVPEQPVRPMATPERADVRKILESCDPEELELLAATVEGYTSHDLARIKGCKPSTMRVRRMRLRRRLQSKLCSEPVNRRTHRARV